MKSEFPMSGILAVISPDRKISDYPVGNRPISAHHELLATENVGMHPDAWIDPAEFDDFLRSAAENLLDADGGIVASKNGAGDFPARRSFLIRHPWDLIRANEQHVGALERSEISGDTHVSAAIEGFIRLGEGSRILPGVFIEGNVVIGRNCKIGPNCYIRGNTSIGDKCHIGQSVEIKNSLIMAHSNVGHLSYIGDSVIGENANFGAGTVTSNLRHDGKNHRSLAAGILVDTGRRKFGAIIGDGVHTGINTSIYPGRKISAGASTRPGEIVMRDL